MFQVAVPAERAVGEHLEDCGAVHSQAQLPRVGVDGEEARGIVQAPSQRVRPGGRYRGADRKPGGAVRLHPALLSGTREESQGGGVGRGRRPPGGRRDSGSSGRVRAAEESDGVAGVATAVHLVRRVRRQGGVCPPRRDAAPSALVSVAPRVSSTKLLPHGFGKIPSGAVSALRTT